MEMIKVVNPKLPELLLDYDSEEYRKAENAFRQVFDISLNESKNEGEFVKGMTFNPNDRLLNILGRLDPD
jgi:hypothetical protein